MNNRLANKNIIVGVTGGIAAYKSADLVRRLKETGSTVHVVMTQAAKAFITPLTMQAVSGNPVHDDLFSPTAEAAMGHIQLARWADVILIAPATADFIAKLAHGHADDLLSTLCLATTATVAIAPAMNQQMWQDAITQENIQHIQQRGIHLLGPGIGSQACGEFGPGRMLESSEIIEFVNELFTDEQLSSVRVMITAGPTQEAIDPVRYLTNHSSGKMGYALAEAAIAAGASVTLISGPVTLIPPARTQCIHVVTAEQMYHAVFTEIGQCDIFIAAAAVADYRCREIATQKQAKTSEELVLRLVPNPDILKAVAALDKKPFLVGFAAETHDLIKRAKQKLQDKHLDMIVANQVGIPDAGFGSDNNAATLLWKKGQLEFPLMSKHQLARNLINKVAEHYLGSVDTYAKHST